METTDSDALYKTSFIYLKLYLIKYSLTFISSTVEQNTYSIYI